MSMRGRLIRKRSADWRVKPWLTDLAAERESFSWAALRTELLGDAAGGVNIARLAVDRHAGTAVAARDALRFVDAGGRRHALTFEALRLSTNRFANALRALGLQPGDRVYFPRAAQVYVTGQAVRPGAFRYEEGLTVHRLLALAGGPNERGSSKVRLVRLVAGRREERRAQPNDLVEPEDTLVVPERFF